MSQYKLQVTLTEPMLASSPADPEVYKQFIASRARADAKDTGDEVETLDAGEKEKVGWSVFHREKDGHIFIFDYKVRGTFKESCSAVTGKGMTAYKSKIDKWLFVLPRRIKLYGADGKAKLEPDGVLERPIRAMTMQGPRVSLKRSDYVSEGTTFTCGLTVLPLGETDITEERLRDWLNYGVWSGYGEWRSGSYGRYTYKLEKVA